MGFLQSCGVHVPRRKVRHSMTRIDPANVTLRWGAAVYRRSYQALGQTHCGILMGIIP